jgi:chromosome segregation ATPase
VEEIIGVEVEEQIATIRRAMEKLSNEKIMAINEYSDTVLESMNKTHNEIMFLYSMLNDKHKELTDLAGQLDEIPRQIHGQEKEAMERLNAQISVVEQKVKEAAPLQEKELLEAAASNNAAGNNAAGSTVSGGTAAGSTASKKRATSSLVEKNHNDDILFLHDAGKTDVEIAKDLGLGLGEVKLVIGLFKEGN